MVNARFIKSAKKPIEYPREKLPEIAVVGRSNVGKSSLLNHLFNKKGLVKVSQTPGKTQLINFFETDSISFVDLPGYGFAKVPSSVRAEWGPMIETYLTNRKTLRLILLLIDNRRDPDEEDIKMAEWVLSRNLPLLVVATKTDKSNQSELIKNLRRIRETLSIPEDTILPYTVQKDKGREALFGIIKEYTK